MKRLTREVWAVRGSSADKRGNEFAAELGVSVKSLRWWKRWQDRMPLHRLESMYARDGIERGGSQEKSV